MIQRELIIFTASFPYGIKEHWKENEIIELNKHFRSITIIPYSNAGVGSFADHRLEFARIEQPLFTESVFIKPAMVFQLITRRLPAYFGEFLRQRVFLSKKKLIAFINAAWRVEAMLKTDTIRNLLIRQDKEQVVLYFYWGVGAAFIAPFLKGYRNIVSRFHRFDLYENENNGYIPFRMMLFKKLKFAILISQHGLEYLKNRYTQYSQKFRLFRIGAVDHGDAIPSNDDVLRVVSCSTVTPVKRVNLLLQSLKALSFPVEWTHIGGGPLLESLQKESVQLPANVHVTFTGEIDSKDVMVYYVNQKVDLFINVSSSEGVPVSIMEALSASVPVVATNVGGTAEIIDRTVGSLIPADFSTKFLAKELKRLYELPFSEKLKLRASAKKKYNLYCNSAILDQSFAEFLSRS